MRNATEVASGASESANANIAAKNNNCPLTDKPSAATSTAFAPKIKIGIYNGKIIKDNKTPPWFTATVKETPIAPIKLNTGVPSNRL